MSIQPIQSSGAQAAQGAQGAQELTTVTTHCDKKHMHDKSCPHTVSTQLAPRMGDDGYLLNQKA